MTIVETRDAAVSRSRLAIGAGVLGIAVDVGYVAIMFDEGRQRSSGRVLVVFLFILAVSSLAVVGGSALVRSVRTKAMAFGAATGGLLTLGVLGIFSIGLPLLVAGVLCGMACGRVIGAVRPVPGGVPILATFAALASGAVVILGMMAT